MTTVLDCVRRIVSALHRGSRLAEKRVGMSSAQLFVLRALSQAPALSINELAQLTHTHQSSVSVVVRRLVEHGLVQRRKASGDARRLELKLTSRARAILRQAPDTAQQRLISSMGRMTAAQRRQLATLMQCLVRDLGAKPAAPAMFFEDSSAI